MPTDDEILERVQRRATVIRRRQRLLVAGAASVVAIALFGGVVVAGTFADDGRDPVDVADQPDTTSTPVAPDTALAPTTDGSCAGAPTDPDLGPAAAGPGGSPSASTDGSGPVDTSSSTTTDSLPAQRTQAGAPPTESSLPPDDDPSAATLPTVEASSTACPLQVEVVATYDPLTRLVDLAVTATAEPRYEAHGSVTWDAVDPVQEDLGAMDRSSGSCDTAGGPEVVDPVRGDFAATHAYLDAGEKQVTVEFWARRCDGPVHQVEVTVTVPL